MIKDLKKPINSLTLSLAAVAIILSIIFYLRSQREMIPTYMIEEPPSKLFDSTHSTHSIRVIDKSGKLVDEDIYLITAVFWNSGELPIEPGEVRKPITFVISGTQRILDTSIVKEVHPDISKFRLVESSTKKNSIEILWDHLDPGDAVKFHVIYTGTEDVNFTFTGNVLGSETIKDARPILLHTGLLTKVVVVILVGLSAIALAFLGGMIADWLPKLRSDNVREAIGLIIAGMILSVPWLFAYFLFFKGTAPPL